MGESETDTKLIRRFVGSLVRGCIHSSWPAQLILLRFAGLNHRLFFFHQQCIHVAEAAGQFAAALAALADKVGEVAGGQGEGALAGLDGQGGQVGQQDQVLEAVCTAL